MLGKEARGSLVYPVCPACPVCPMCPVCYTCSNLTEKSDEIILK